MPSGSTLGAGAVARPVLQRLGAGLVSGKRPLFAFVQSIGIQVFITGINLLTGVVTARLLGPQGRGVYTAVTTWPQLLAMLSVAGLNSAVVFQMRKAPEAAGSVAGGALLLSIGNSVVAVGVGYFVLPVVMGRYDAATVWFAQVCLAGALINSTYMVVKQCFAGRGEFRLFNFAVLWPQLLYLLALLACIPFGTLTATVAAVALLGTSALALLTSLPKLICVIGPRLRGSLGQARRLISFSSRAAAVDVVFALATNADRLVLIPLLSPGELGFYTVAYSFSRVIQLAQPAIASVLLSHLSAQSEAGGKQLHDHALRFLLAALAAVGVVLWLIGEPLLVFTYGAPFAAANAIFRLLLVEASLGVLSQVTIQLLLARDRPGAAACIQVIVLCVSMAALLILVPRFGALGAAGGLVVAGVIRWLLLLGAVRWVLRLPLPRLYLGRNDFRYLLGRLH